MTVAKKKKKGPRFTFDDVENMAPGVQDCECCGVAEYSGLGSIESTRDALALRRAARLGDEFSFNNHGLVFCTVVMLPAHDGGQLDKIPFLKGAGFKKVFSFNNPNTSGTPITVWMAKTLERGGSPSKEEPEYDSRRWY